MRKRKFELRQKDAKTFTKFLREHYACHRALLWRRAQKRRDLRSIVAACPDASWLLWLIVESANDHLSRRLELRKAIPNWNGMSCKELWLCDGVTADEVRALIYVREK